MSGTFQGQLDMELPGSNSGEVAAFSSELEKVPSLQRLSIRVFRAGATSLVAWGGNETCPHTYRQASRNSPLAHAH